MLSLSELREMVRREFGPKLERATPATVREFLDRLQVRFHEESGEGSPYVLSEEPARSFEEILGDFFSRVLDYEPEQAAVALWLLAFEQHYSSLEDTYSDRYLSLFGEGEEK